MARTALTTTQISGGSSSQVGFTAHTWTAADPVNGNKFTSTGKEMLLIRNVNADSPLVSRKVTVYKTAGQVEFTLAGGTYATTGQIPVTGWRQTDTSIWVTGEHADIEMSVVILP